MRRLLTLLIAAGAALVGLAPIASAAPDHHCTATGTTYTSVVLYTPGIGLTGWGWFWVVFAGLLDIGHWVAGASQRRSIPGYRGD